MPAALRHVVIFVLSKEYSPTCLLHSGMKKRSAGIVLYRYKGDAPEVFLVHPGGPFWKNKDACFNPRYKALGMFAMPNILLFQIILPMLAPLADAMLIISLIWNHHNPESMNKIGTCYLLFLLLDVLVSLVSFSFENEKPGKLCRRT